MFKNNESKNSIGKNMQISNNSADMNINTNKMQQNERSTDTLMPIRADNESGKIDYD